MVINGVEVTKIEDVPERFRHLWHDASFVQCNKCGRKSYGDKPNADCKMPQPSGNKCNGIFIGKI